MVKKPAPPKPKPAPAGPGIRHYFDSRLGGGQPQENYPPANQNVKHPNQSKKPKTSPHPSQSQGESQNPSSPPLVINRHLSKAATAFQPEHNVSQEDCIVWADQHPTDFIAAPSQQRQAPEKKRRLVESLAARPHPPAKTLDATHRDDQELDKILEDLDQSIAAKGRAGYGGISPEDRHLPARILKTPATGFLSTAGKHLNSRQRFNQTPSSTGRFTVTKSQQLKRAKTNSGATPFGKKLKNAASVLFKEIERKISKEALCGGGIDTDSPPVAGGSRLAVDNTRQGDVHVDAAVDVVGPATRVHQTVKNTMPHGVDRLVNAWAQGVPPAEVAAEALLEPAAAQLPPSIAAARNAKAEASIDAMVTAWANDAVNIVASGAPQNNAPLMPVQVDAVETPIRPIVAPSAPAEAPAALPAVFKSHQNFVDGPPPSPYVRNAPPSQKVILPKDAAHCIERPSALKGNAIDWGDSDDEDIDLDHLENVEAAYLLKQQQRTDASLSPPEPQAPSTSAQAQNKYAGDRDQVHFIIRAIWTDCADEQGINETQLHLYSPYSSLSVIAHLRSPWDDGDYRVGDPINLIVPSMDNFQGVLHCRLGRDLPGMLVQYPDVLLGGTRIAGSLNCIRQGYLAEKIAGVDGTNDKCTKGNLYHSLFQSALRWAGNAPPEVVARGKADRDAAMKRWLEREIEGIVAGRAMDLLDSGMTEEEAREYLRASLTWTKDWMYRSVARLATVDNGTSTYGRGHPSNAGNTSNIINAGCVPSLDASGADVKRCLSINNVVDIEEYIAAPKYGLKGYVDASIAVTVQQPPNSNGRFGGPFQAVPRQQAPNKQKDSSVECMIAPLELKTGTKKPSDSAQVLLYLLLMEGRYGYPLQWGLLVHKGKEDTLVARQEHNLMCIMAIRNRLAAALARAEMPGLAPLATSCQWCYEKTSCMLTHAANGRNKEDYVENKLPEGSRPRIEIEKSWDLIAGHLTEDDQKFLKHWSDLLDLEAADSKGVREEVWSRTGEEREKAGRCISNLTIVGVQNGEDRGVGGWLYTFAKRQGSRETLDDDGVFRIACSFPLGEMLMLSVDGRHAGITRGHLYELSETSMTVHVDKQIRDGLLWSGPGGKVNTKDSTNRPVLCDPSLSWRLDQEEVLTTIPRMRGFLYSLFYNSTSSDGYEDPLSRQAARLRSLIVALDSPAPPVGKQQYPLSLLQAVEREVHALKLNPEQSEAVRRAVACEDYTLVLGMPGAGKTTAIVAMLRALAAAGKRVLLTSYTNSAVDNVLLKLARSGDVNFLRVGREGRVHPELLPWTVTGAKHNARTVSELAKLADTVPIMGVSALGATDTLVRRAQFDVCIVDEAGQITLPATIGPLLRARSFVLVGDPHQLPPLVTSRSAAEGGLDESLFARLMKAHPQAVVSLPVQYRMADEVMVLPNILTYQGKLRCGCTSIAEAQLSLDISPGEKRHNLGFLSSVLAPERRVIFCDTKSLPAPECLTGEAVSNPTEAELVLKIIKGLKSAGASGDSIAVISPYRHQVALLTGLVGAEGKHMEGIEVLTIDKAQGRDKDCVIVSFVRSNTERRAGKLLKDERRINVALTRAKKKLVLIGDGETLQTVAMFEKMLGVCTERGWLLEVPASYKEGR